MCIRDRNTSVRAGDGSSNMKNTRWGPRGWGGGGAGNGGRGVGVGVDKKIHHDVHGLHRVCPGEVPCDHGVFNQINVSFRLFTPDSGPNF